MEKQKKVVILPHSLENSWACRCYTVAFLLLMLSVKVTVTVKLVACHSSRAKAIAATLCYSNEAITILQGLQSVPKTRSSQNHQDCSHINKTSNSIVHECVNVQLVIFIHGR